MPAKSYKSLLNKITTIILLVFVFPFAVSAQLENLKQEARVYRDKGYQAQGAGDLDTAKTYYQKAIELDPLYTAAYNDLGVLYETKGVKDKAEENYLKAVQVDPYYQSAYFNLANLYEEQGDLRKAAEFWKKRVKLGAAHDRWTEKARQRLANIGMIIEDIGQELKQEETADLIKSLSTDKDYLEKKAGEVITRQKQRADMLFVGAQAYYSKGDFTAALKDAGSAHFLDPANSEIEKFIDKVRAQLSAHDH